MDNLDKCSCLCPSDCNWPWSKDKAEEDSNVEVDFHFRGRIDSTNSVEKAEPVLAIQIVMEQPQPEVIEVIEKPKKHKVSVSSLDSAIFSTASGILNQVLLERHGSAGGDGPQAMLSLELDEAAQKLLVNLISMKNYNSMFLLKSSANMAKASAESSSLLSPIPSLMMRVSLEPAGDQIAFTSIHSRSKHPVWKEQLVFDIDPKERGDQKLVVVLYESNRFSRWTPVKLASHSLKEVTFSGTHNLSFELKNVSSDDQTYGEIKLAFCYNKVSSRIFCDIMEVRSLLHYGLNRKAEYFVRVQFLERKKLVKMKKTSAGRPETTSVLQINETFRAKVPVASLNALTVRVLVCDAKTIIGDSSLYVLSFSQDGDSGPSESTYWSDFIRELPATGKKQWFSLSPK